MCNFQKGPIHLPGHTFEPCKVKLSLGSVEASVRNDPSGNGTRSSTRIGTRLVLGSSTPVLGSSTTCNWFEYHCTRLVLGSSTTCTRFEYHLYPVRVPLYSVQVPPVPGLSTTCTRFE